MKGSVLDVKNVQIISYFSTKLPSEQGLSWLNVPWTYLCSTTLLLSLSMVFWMAAGPRRSSSVCYQSFCKQRTSSYPTAGFSRSLLMCDSLSSYYSRTTFSFHRVYSHHLLMNSVIRPTFEKSGHLASEPASHSTGTLESRHSFCLM